MRPSVTALFALLAGASAEWQAAQQAMHDCFTMNCPDGFDYELYSYSYMGDDDWLDFSDLCNSIQHNSEFLYSCQSADATCSDCAPGTARQLWCMPRCTRLLAPFALSSSHGTHNTDLFLLDFDLVVLRLLVFLPLALSLIFTPFHLLVLEVVLQVFFDLWLQVLALLLSPAERESARREPGGRSSRQHPPARRGHYPTDPLV